MLRSRLRFALDEDDVDDDIWEGKEGRKGGRKTGRGNGGGKIRANEGRLACRVAAPSVRFRCVDTHQSSFLST